MSFRCRFNRKKEALAQSCRYFALSLRMRVPHERLGAEKEVGNNTQVSSGKKEEEEVVVIIIMIEDEINK